ncbi:hypothetical protein F3N42_05940 [Marinihelvus fidelis]|uniref:Ysc84 actin-binding domain-containing protein n=1 Tax=Marinihelvus fidelis TaxID=2613842 RepID=A0A5N0TCI9_9GAMM|nr:YSC84-related protein [Marinihelvus fidelis]KAA9132752.1 hypothetical protein F3N42_05940 [Marinihelvus fidelis]
MRKLTLALVAVLGLSLATGVAAATPEECQEALGKFKELGNVTSLLGESHGYAILPTIGKGGIGIGGATGKGCVYKGDSFEGEVRMTQVSIGLQLGGQAYSQLILLKNSEIYDEFVGGSFEFGADANAVALTYGASATAGTQGNSAGVSATESSGTGVGEWRRGMAVFTLAKGGLMYQAAIAGQKYKFKAK